MKKYTGLLKGSYSAVRPVLAGMVCMVAISGLQYAWTLFVLPMSAAHSWSKADIQWSFALFINMQAWLLLLYGYFVDKKGARSVMLAGGVLVAASWVVNSYASTLWVLFAGQALGGVGTGLVIAAAYGGVLKEYTKRRGLAVGLISAGYGFGAALSVGYIASLIASVGYQGAFFWAGLAQGAVIVFVALFFVDSKAKEEVQKMGVSLHSTISGLKETLRELGKTVFTLPFALMYAMFALVAAGGLMVTAQLAPIAGDYGIDKVLVTIFGITFPTVLWAVKLDRITNGLSRPFFGFVSDYLGRERTLILVFVLEAFAVLMLMLNVHNPVAFVLLSGLVFFGWGEIFSLFPSLCTDVFGTERATTNYGALYTAKGLASFFVPLASVVSVGGQWGNVFYLVIAFDIVAAYLAFWLLVLRRKA
jgi:OFA family oxalate/formate antiporter-like MFS transporter